MKVTTLTLFQVLFWVLWLFAFGAMLMVTTLWIWFRMYGPAVVGVVHLAGMAFLGWRMRTE